MSQRFVLLSEIVGDDKTRPVHMVAAHVVLLRPAVSFGVPGTRICLSSSDEVVVRESLEDVHTLLEGALADTASGSALAEDDEETDGDDKVATIGVGSIGASCPYCNRLLQISALFKPGESCTCEFCDRHFLIPSGIDTGRFTGYSSRNDIGR